MEISASTIKAFREKTGAPVMMIRKALTEAEGDEKKAFEYLQKFGAEVASKKESRAATAGTIGVYVHHDKRVVALVLLRSETDFVGKNEEFQGLARRIAMHVAAMDSADVTTLLAEPFVQDPSRMIGDLVVEAGAKFGEHIFVEKFVRYTL